MASWAMGVTMSHFLFARRPDICYFYFEMNGFSCEWMIGIYLGSVSTCLDYGDRACALSGV